VKQPFAVSYTWADGEHEYQGHTVSSGVTADEAVALLRRRNPCLTDAWLTGSREPKLKNSKTLSAVPAVPA